MALGEAVIAPSSEDTVLLTLIVLIARLAYSPKI
jgi:hypothetical protein